jgi:hypothetical protein
MATQAHPRDELMHVGAGSGLGLIQLAAIIPGLIPTLGLLGVVMAVALLPTLVLGLAASLVAAPPFCVWLLAARGRRRRAAQLDEPSPRLDATATTFAGHSID